MNQRAMGVVFILLIVLMIASIGSLMLGQSDVGFHDLVSYFFDRANSEQTREFILFDLRMPRTLAAIGVGASLGLAGAILQTLLTNPLAEPYTLGVSGGSAFGAILGLVLFSSTTAMIVGSFFGSWFVTFFLLILVQRQRLPSRDLILMGVMITLLSGSLTSLLMSFLEARDLQTSYFWMMGQLGGERDRLWPLIGIFFAVIFVVCSLKSQEFDRLLLGEELASSLGLRLKRFQILSILSASILSSLAVAIAGLLGFVGLLSPHLARRCTGTALHRSVFIASALLGAIILVAADTLGRVVRSQVEVPAGGLVALIGAPFLIFLLVQKRGLS